MVSSASSHVYTWNGYRCAYDLYPGPADRPTLLLIHPLGVGLARWFWHRFCDRWAAVAPPHPICNPDLLGCGDSDKPAAAYRPADWGAQLCHLIETELKRPVVLVVQGASFPLALAVAAQLRQPELLRGLVLSGPPGWGLISQGTRATTQNLLWNLLFSGPVGAAFYRYARREAFLTSFSQRQLFANPADIDREWLDQLQADAQDGATRFAVFSFLAGFWRQDYTAAIEALSPPTLVLYGQQASGIGRASRGGTPEERLKAYLQRLPQGTGQIIPGRNVLPYEATEPFVAAMAPWLAQLT